MEREITFRISSWTPETLPMARLGQYLVELARLYGEPANVHFKRVRKGSAVLVSSVDEPAVPKVERRLNQARSPEAPAEIAQAFGQIDQMLADDNATGAVRVGRSNNVVVFPGRNRPAPVAYGLVRQDGFLDGELVRIGGRDRTVHLQLQDGDRVHGNIMTDRETARSLGKLIFGPTLRLWGAGSWRRSPAGDWTVEAFRVARFEVLDDRDLVEAVSALQSVPGNGWHLDPDPLSTILRSRNGDAAGGAG